MKRQLITALAIIIWARSATELGPEQKLTPCNSPCDGAKRLQRRLETYTTAFTVAQGRHNAALLDYFRLVSATSSGSLDFKKKAAPVLAAAAELIDACRSSITDAETKIAKATATVSAAISKYQTAAQLIGSKTQLKVAPDGSSHIATAQLSPKTLGGITETKCDNTKADTDGKTMDLEKEKLEEKPKRCLRMPSLKEPA
ncbi:uncharacterized protein TEOVI_000635900 [Trypanosoma equiperdum]|uniref:Trypanosome variant surface glycoprotein (A-type) n=1 Tax=Trypanosoma equiperdum TaxID=5694 RepID=A0A1G4I5A2_TRYEQ|nr:hypothetical protein TEOVI_000635900 [Trypanosoma equiperdum]